MKIIAKPRVFNIEFLSVPTLVNWFFCFWHLKPILIGGFYIAKKHLQKQSKAKQTKKTPHQKKHRQKFIKLLFLKFSLIL